MSEPLVINTLAGAFIAGLATSLHCAGMCGPLLCATLPKPSVGYHGGRLLSYGGLGMICGAIGAVPLRGLLHSPFMVLPWFLALVLLLFACGLKPRLPRPRWLQSWQARRLLQSRGAIRYRGFFLGLATPLLPCAPLYLMLGACLVSGSAMLGLQFAIAFALGTMPLLWLAQTSLGVLKMRLSPIRLRQLQRGLALFAALFLVWRLALPLLQAPTTPAEVPCPMCHE